MKKIKKAIAATALSVSIITPATMLTANAAVLTYTVKSGDTLLAIAKRYNVSLTSLESANKITNQNIIKAGEVLTIPTTSTTTAAAAAKTTAVNPITYTVYTGTVTITTSTSLYASPSTSSKILKALPKGSKWKIYGYQSDGWYSLGCGWVKASSVSASLSTKGATTVVSGGSSAAAKPSTTSTATIATNTKTNNIVTFTLYTGTATITTATSLYASPSTSSKILEALPKGSKWKVYGYRSDGWYSLGPGWVKASCVSVSILTKGATTVVSGGTSAPSQNSTANTSTTATTGTLTVSTGSTSLTGSTGSTVSTSSTGSTATIGSTPPSTTSTTAGVPVPPAPAKGQMIYKVLQNDNATSIANKYNMTLAELQLINPQVTNWNTLTAMQQILVGKPNSALTDVIVNNNVTTDMRAAFIAEVVPAAIQAWQTNKILPSLTIAQAILESYWGESYLSVNAQNYFGIKASAGWKGATITLPTNEYDANGNLYVENAAFRAYTSISDSIADHTQFLMASRYANLVGVTDYKIATTLIQQDGYATDPKYTNLLQSQITAYNLTQYDGQAGVIPVSN